MPRARDQLWAILAVTLLVLLGCGDDKKAPPRVPPSDDANSGVDTRAPRSFLAYSKPKVRKDPRDGHVASLRGKNGAIAKLRVRSLGYPGYGTTGGQKWFGPGVTLPWGSIAQGTYTASIGFSGKDLSLVVWSRGGSWQARVGRRTYPSEPAPVGSGYAYHSLSLHFRGAKRRVVEFTLSHGAWVSALRTGRHDKTWLPPARHIPSVYWLGDSFSTGAGARHPGFTDLVQDAARRLRTENVTVDALGGTGYVKSNGAAKFPNFLTRARASLGSRKVRPDVVVVAGSINDTGYGSQQTRQAAAQLFAAVRKGAPRAKVVVVPLTGSYPVSPALSRAIDGVRRAAGDAPNVVGVFDLPRAAEALGVEGLQRADGHPTQRGHDLYGRLIAKFVAERIPSLRR